MELTNEQRRCLGLLEVEPYWERVDMGKGNILYFNGDVIRKWIIDREGHSEEHTYLLGEGIAREDKAPP